MVTTTSKALKGLMMIRYLVLKRQNAVNAIKPSGAFQHNAKCQTGLTGWEVGKTNISRKLLHVQQLLELLLMAQYKALALPVHTFSFLP